MSRIWAKIMLDNKIKKQVVIDVDYNYSLDKLPKYLTEICYRLNLETPILLNKHFNEIQNFNKVKFDKSDFVDTYPYDSLIIENLE